MEPKYALVFVWFVWLVSWIAAAQWAKATVKVPAGRSELPYRVLQFIGFFFVFAALGRVDDDPHVRSVGQSVLLFLFERRWELSPLFGWLAVLLAASGFGLAWWARVHLAELWSSSVTRKEGHSVVDTGPYRIVRHPIYTGLLLATLALAATSERLLGLIGFVIVVVALVLKARLEETFLSAELGADAYGAYKVRVPMLVPGLYV